MFVSAAVINDSDSASVVFNDSASVVFEVVVPRVVELSDTCKTETNLSFVFLTQS